MIEIPFSHLSYTDDVAWERWDQRWIKRILDGEEWVPAQAFEFVERPWDPSDGDGRVIVFPAGQYIDPDQPELEEVAIKRLLTDLRKLPWAVLIATSDEASKFRWGKIHPWPEHVALWVMTPDPDKEYPRRTFFIGDGSPHRPVELPWSKELAVGFIGQVNTDRRREALEAMWASEALDEPVVADRTDGFGMGLPRIAYMNRMTNTWIAPCPSGVHTQDTFRLFEALEADCIPIADAIRPGDEEPNGYWDMIGMSDIFPVIEDWHELPSLASRLLERRHWNAALVSSRWQQYKRMVSMRLHADLRRVTHHARLFEGVDQHVTVIVPTSPIPSHPNTSMIRQTIASIRAQLPTAEILITCDGLRPEQEDRREAYDEFLSELCRWTNRQHNICPIVHTEHRHQSGMMLDVLDQIETPYVLYVEADCPLEGEIPWDDILNEMGSWNLHSMRFYHFDSISEGSEHLFALADVGWVAKFRPTVQWSQRPHLARTDWYRDIMERQFDDDARTFIEDVMHGVVQHGLPHERPDESDEAAYAWRIRLDEVWAWWRMAVYAPEGSWKRSGHLDGRGDDPKFPMLVKYPPDARPGGPQEGWMPA